MQRACRARFQVINGAKSARSCRLARSCRCDRAVLHATNARVRFPICRAPMLASLIWPGRVRYTCLAAASRWSAPASPFEAPAHVERALGHAIRTHPLRLWMVDPRPAKRPSVRYRSWPRVAASPDQWLGATRCPRSSRRWGRRSLRSDEIRRPFPDASLTGSLAQCLQSTTRLRYD